MMFPSGNVGELVQGLYSMNRGISSIPASPKLGARDGGACLLSQDSKGTGRMIRNSSSLPSSTT